MTVGHVGGSASLAAASARQNASIAGLNLAQNAQKAEGQAVVALLESVAPAESVTGQLDHTAHNAIGEDGHVDTFA